MRRDWLRALAVGLFAAGAALAGIGNEEHDRLLVALSFGCFAGGAMAFLRWRAANR